MDICGYSIQSYLHAGRPQNLRNNTPPRLHCNIWVPIRIRDSGFRVDRLQEFESVGICVQRSLDIRYCPESENLLESVWICGNSILSCLVPAHL